jgi:hypothetical protein
MKVGHLAALFGRHLWSLGRSRRFVRSERGAAEHRNHPE